MTISDLKKQAIKNYNWYIHNVSTGRLRAIAYAESIYKHAFNCGYITEHEYKKLLFSLPFDTYLK